MAKHVHDAVRLSQCPQLLHRDALRGERAQARTLERTSLGQVDETLGGSDWQGLNTTVKSERCQEPKAPEAMPTNTTCTVVKLVA